MSPRPADTFEIVTDIDRFHALRPDWDSLWARSAAPRFSQSFDWCLAGWQTTGAPRGRRLRIVVMRADGRAVVIWPMTVGRLLLWRLARPLGPEASEYDPVLVEDGPEAQARLHAAWCFVRARCQADVIKIPLVRHETVMRRMLAADRPPCDAKTMPCQSVAWDAASSWDAYWRARDPRLRRDIDRRRRRLAERGAVTTAVIDDPAALPDVIDWTIAAKARWLVRKRQSNDFLRTPGYRAFLHVLGAATARTGRLVAFVLHLDRHILATEIAVIDDGGCEMFVRVFDPAFAAYSPGHLLFADSLQWCQQHGLDCDLRIGAEPYKHLWANGRSAATTYHVAVTRWGALMLAAHRLRQRRRASPLEAAPRPCAPWRHPRQPEPRRAP